MLQMFFHICILCVMYGKVYAQINMLWILLSDTFASKVVLFYKVTGVLPFKF